MSPPLLKHFALDSCPHCGRAQPTLAYLANGTTNDFRGQRRRNWIFYACTVCGGVVSAYGDKEDGEAKGYFPEQPAIDDAIPAPTRDYLQQARDSRHAPSGAVMLAGSAVDSMLKIHGLTSGALYTRIGQAAEKHLITQEMARWAHDIRLDANDARHADLAAPLPTGDDADRSIDFAFALAEVLFVLPARVKRGLAIKADLIEPEQKNHGGFVANTNINR